MNRYEIEIAEEWLRPHPVAGAGAKILLLFQRAVDGCSDGWAHWSKPTRAAKLLMELVDSMYRSHHARDPMTQKQLLAVCRPIRKFIQWVTDERGIEFALTLDEFDILLGLKKPKQPRFRYAKRKIRRRGEGVDAEEVYRKKVGRGKEQRVAICYQAAIADNLLEWLNSGGDS